MAHEKDTLIALVLDKSGSMAGLRQSTVDGFNQFLDEQRGAENAGDAFVSLTLFDTSFDVRYVGVPIDQVPPLGSPTNQYTTGGNTALYDAVGVTVKGAEAWVANQDFGGKVVVVIMTDGQENQSRQWHIWPNPSVEDDKDLNNVIQAKQNEGWEFVFLGAGQSAWLEAKHFTAIPHAHQVSYAASAASHAGTYAGTSATMTNLRSANFAGDSSYRLAGDLMSNTASVAVEDPTGEKPAEHKGRITTPRSGRKKKN